jgi:hypothetical protein
MTRYRTILISLVAAVLALACGQAPQEDVTAAETEIARAREAQADVWAPNEFQAADQAMGAARTEIAAQNQKWFKNYDRAAELLAKARDEAARAAEAAGANKEQARQDAEKALADAESALLAAEAAHKAAPVTKDSKADLALYRSDLDGLRQTLAAARQAFDAGDYKRALESTASVKDMAGRIAADLQAAKQKRMGARKG